MSNEAIPYEEVVSRLEEAADAVYEAQEVLVKDVTEALNNLKAHVLDVQAHGISAPDSYFRKAIEQLIKDGITNSSSDGFLVDSLINSGIISDNLDLNSSTNIASSKALKQVYDYATNVNNQLASLSSIVSSHATNKNNPHSVNKEQVGLGNIPNAISDAVNSASSSQLATSKAVKTAYDTAVSANNNANTRVAKAGDTMTGALTIALNGRSAILKNTSDIRATAPSSTLYTYIEMHDKNGTAIGQLTHGHYTDGRSSTYIATYGQGGKSATLEVNVDASGNGYASCPTPVSSSNTTHVATTAWVRTFTSTASVAYATNAGNSYQCVCPSSSGIANTVYKDIVQVNGNNGNRIFTVRATRHDTNGNSVLIGVHKAGTNDAPNGLTVSMNASGAISASLPGTMTVNSPASGSNDKTVATTAWAVPKVGNRGTLKGYDTSQSLNNSQTITIDSAESINLSTTGAVVLTFTAAAATAHSVKVICLKAASTTVLTINGAVWANNGEAPTWGTSGKILVLLAHFVNGRVVLSVSDNTQS